MKRLTDLIMLCLHLHDRFKVEDEQVTNHVEKACYSIIKA